MIDIETFEKIEEIIVSYGLTKYMIEVEKDVFNKDEAIKI